MDKSSSIKIIVIILVVIVNIIALTCAFSSIYTTAKRVASSTNAGNSNIDLSQDDTTSSTNDEESGDLNLVGVLGNYFKVNGISTILYAVEMLVGINLIIIAIILMIKIRKL